MHSTFFKSFITTILLVVICFTLIGVAFSITSRGLFVAETQSSVMSTAKEITNTAVSFADNDDLASLELRMMLTTVAKSTNEFICIADAEGYVISCSDDDILCHHIGRKMDESILQISSGGKSHAAFTTLNGFFDTGYYVVAAPIADNAGVRCGYVFVGRDNNATLAVWESIVPLFIFISLAVLVIALIITYLSSRYLVQPLKEISAAARKFGRGDLSVRVESNHREDEIRELTEAFNTMADSLEKSEEKRREFVANVSHELKTPMTTIAGFADGILDGTIPPESEKKYLQTISSETKRLSRLVRSMLELSRLQADDRVDLLQKSFDIAEVLRLTIVNFVDKIEGQRLDVDFQVPEDAMPVRGDIDAITQVVYNLMDNAIKFSSPGSTLGVSLWKDEKKAYISVRNHGETIPESEIPLLFDRFHKTDKSRSLNRDGVGLGLYIVKTILNNHGEDIAVTSREGVTEFVFTLGLKG